MREVEIEALVRAVMPLFIFAFALKGRYWWLACAAFVGLVSSLLTAEGVPRLWTGRVGYVFYVFFTIHALDITRKVHSGRG